MEIIKKAQKGLLNLLFFGRRKVEMLMLVSQDLDYPSCFDNECSWGVSNLKASVHQAIASLFYFARMNVKELSDQEIMDIVVPKQQLIVICQSNEFEGLIADLAQQVRETPDFKSQSSTVRLHYFYGGSDWWITQIDLDLRLGYGFVCLNGTGNALNMAQYLSRNCAVWIW